MRYYYDTSHLDDDMKRAFIITGFIMSLILGILYLAERKNYVSLNDATNNWKSVSGVFTELKTYTSGKGVPYYVINATYEISNEKLKMPSRRIKYTFVPFNIRSLRSGDRIDLRYNPSKPSESIWTCDEELYSTKSNSRIYGFLAGSLFSIAAICWVAWRSERKHEKA